MSGQYCHSNQRPRNDERLNYNPAVVDQFVIKRPKKGG